MMSFSMSARSYAENEGIAISGICFFNECSRRQRVAEAGGPAISSVFRNGNLSVQAPAAALDESRAEFSSPEESPSEDLSIAFLTLGILCMFAPVMTL